MLDTNTPVGENGHTGSSLKHEMGTQNVCLLHDLKQQLTNLLLPFSLKSIENQQFWKQTMTRCGVNKSKTNHFMNLQSSLRGKESIELDAKTLRSKQKYMTSKAPMPRYLKVLKQDNVLETLCQWCHSLHKFLYRNLPLLWLYLPPELYLQHESKGNLQNTSFCTLNNIFNKKGTKS